MTDSEKENNKVDNLKVKSCIAPGHRRGQSETARRGSAQSSQSEARMQMSAQNCSAQSSIKPDVSKTRVKVPEPRSGVGSRTNRRTKTCQPPVRSHRHLRERTMHSIINISKTRAEPIREDSKKSTGCIQVGASLRSTARDARRAMRSITAFRA